MTWLLNHKIFILLLVAGFAYWFGNPPDRFGIVRPGFVVYNHIPICFFDCYVAPDGRLYPESQLELPVNVNYWYEQHFTTYRNTGSALLPLLIGYGFSDSARIAVGPRMLKLCRDQRFEPHISSTPEAIQKYNALRSEGKTVAILLKLR